jgi:Skp family chaperone for outer membrane proteins
MGRTRSAPDGGAVDDGAADSSPQKRSKKGDKKVDKNLNKTTEALDDALADSLAEAAMVEGEPSSQTRKAGTERRDLLEQRKKTEEARAEAEELRRRVKQLEEQRNKALVEANSGKISAKSSEKSVTFIPDTSALDTDTLFGSQSLPPISLRRISTERSMSTKRFQADPMMPMMPWSLFRGLSPLIVVPDFFAGSRLP